MDLRKYRDRQVVLVDEWDNELGEVSLVEAHRGKGQKHRAFSLVLYRKTESGVEVLLQKRAEDKPVFAHYWGNTCCYNMAPGEEYLERARSRVKEEMGVELGETKLKKLYQFSYDAPDPAREGWGENELDQVIVGEWDPSAHSGNSGQAGSGQVKLNPEEAEAYEWMEWEEVKKSVRKRERRWAPWWVMMVEDGRLEQEMVG